jgi:hypothetical protein
MGIALLTIPLWSSVWNNAPASLKWPFILLAAVSTALAASATVTLGPWTLVGNSPAGACGEPLQRVPCIGAAVLAGFPRRFRFSRSLP